MGIGFFRLQRLGQDVFYSAHVDEVHVQSIAAGCIEESSVGLGLQRDLNASVRDAMASATPAT